MCGDDPGDRERTVGEHRTDLGQREPRRLQRDDAAEAFQLRGSEDAAAGGGAQRADQSARLVEAQRAGAQPGAADHVGDVEWRDVGWRVHDSPGSG